MVAWFLSAGKVQLEDFLLAATGNKPFCCCCCNRLPACLPSSQNLPEGRADEEELEEEEEKEQEATNSFPDLLSGCSLSLFPFLVQAGG
jgi:hypothetical protein